MSDERHYTLVDDDAPQGPEQFDSARDAIDAVSSFESDAVEDFDYDIRMNDTLPFAYVVTVYYSGNPNRGQRLKAGYLA